MTNPIVTLDFDPQDGVGMHPFMQRGTTLGTKAWMGRQVNGQMQWFDRAPANGGRFIYPDLAPGDALRFGDTTTQGKRWAHATVLGVAPASITVSVTGGNVTALFEGTVRAVAPAPTPASRVAGNPKAATPPGGAAGYSGLDVNGGGGGGIHGGNPPAQPTTFRGGTGGDIPAAGRDTRRVWGRGAAQRVPDVNEPADDIVGEGLLPMFIRPRTILGIGALKPTEANSSTVEEVATRLRYLNEKQEPQDKVVPIGMIDLEVEKGMVLVSVKGTWEGGGVLGMTQTGMRTLFSAVLGNHGVQYGAFRQLFRVLMNEGIEEAATILPLTWHLLLKKYGNNMVNLRTVMTCDPRVDSPCRVIRAVTSSGGYTPVDDHTLINSLLANQEWRGAVVTSYQKTDDYSSMRILPNGLPKTTGTPVAMLNIRNSETGCSSVGLDGGSYTLVCTNGLFHHKLTSSLRWNHVGDVQRIIEGITSGAKAQVDVANGVVAAHMEARDVRVEAMTVWLSQRLTAMRKGGMQVKQRTEEAALSLLGKHTEAPASSLAEAVDAMTLAAQAEPDLDSRRDAEGWAYFLMESALADIRKQREAGKEAVLIPLVEKKGRVSDQDLRAMAEQ